LTLNEFYKENLSDVIEVFDFGLQDWIYHSQKLPFGIHSIKSLQINSQEIILYGGLRLNEENKFECNTQVFLYNCQSNKIEEWVNLSHISENKENYLNILMSKNEDSSRLYILLTKNHSDCAFEFDFDLVILDLVNLTINSFPSLSNIFVDEFKKKVFKPIDIQEDENEVIFTCQHMHIQTCLVKTSIPLKHFESKSILTQNLTFNKIVSDTSLGSDPILLKKSDKNVSSLLPLVLSQINKNINLSPDSFVIKNNMIMIYNLDSNKVIQRKIPSLFHSYFKKSECIFLNDDLVFICGGFKISKLATQVTKERSNLCFLYSIINDKWIVPLCLRDSSDETFSNVTFVNSKLLTTNEPKTNHKMIIYKESSKCFRLFL
jgi:hypothetical protein